jgi:hypothetical protein
VKIDVGALIALTEGQDTRNKDGWTENACRGSLSMCGMVCFTHKDSDILNNEISTKALDGRQLPHLTIANEAGDSNVLICTGLDETPSEGWLSGVSAFTKRAGSVSFQELWTVELGRSSLCKLNHS